MKILIYTESYFPNMGGLEKNSGILANTLAKDHDVTLLTAVLANHSTDSFSNFKILRSQKWQVIQRAVKNTDLLIVNGGIAIKVVLWATMFRIPFWAIYQMANLFFQADRKSAFGKINNRFRRFLASKAKYNIAVSEYSAGILKHYFPEKGVKFLLNPVDLDFENLAYSTSVSKKTPVKFLFLGRLIEGKGIFILINAFRRLLAIGGIELHIAGEGPEMERIKTLIENEKTIYFHGKVEGKKLIELYQSSSLCIIPSHSHIEGSPLVIAEAITCLTPLLVSDQPAMENSVRSAGFSFQSGNEESLYSKMCEFLENRTLAALLTENCKIEKQRFSYETYKSKVKSLILN